MIRVSAAVFAVSVVLAGSGLASAEVVALERTMDATIYAPDYDWGRAGANGSGQRLVLDARTCAADGFARALVAFDIAGQIPAGSRIISVKLTMWSVTGDTTVRLHRLTEPWGEGPSDPPGDETCGIWPPAPGDVTWDHRLYPNLRWTESGGTYMLDASAQAWPRGGGATPTSGTRDQ